MPIPAGRWTFNARLERIVDGDTLYLVFSLGFGATITEDVRLADINTPELVGPDHAAAVAAMEAATSWLRDAEASPGDSDWPLIVETKRVKSTSLRDKYGRYLAKVYRASDPEGVSLNDFLVNGGYAKPFMVGAF